MELVVLSLPYFFLLSLRCSLTEKTEGSFDLTVLLSYLVKHTHD